MRQPHIIFLLGQYGIVSKMKDTIWYCVKKQETQYGIVSEKQYGIVPLTQYGI